MADTSSGEAFHKAVRGARGVISRIRADGKMRDTEFKHGFFQYYDRSARSEADRLDKYLDAIVQARYDDGPTCTTDSNTQDSTGQKEEIPF